MANAREALTMDFGDHVRPADTMDGVTWIERACRGQRGTVGALVPNHYQSVLRVHAPAPCPGDDWWSLYRELFHAVASVGERHTSSPSRAWFAIWEGHGFVNATTHIAPGGPLHDEAQLALEHERERLRVEDQRRNAAIRAALDQIPRFDRPDRRYYLLEGPVSAATQLHYPDSVDEWRNPDLFWPDDRHWFVATDVDFWSLYIGGSDDFIADLVRGVPTRAEPVALHHPLEIED